MIIITMNLAIVIVGTVLLPILFVLVYKFYYRTKQRKYNILKTKQFGGIKLTDKEIKFIKKNSNISMRVVIKKKRFSWKAIKERIKNFLIRLNPFFTYKEKIKKLEKDLSNSRSHATSLSNQVSSLRNDTGRLEKIVKDLKDEKNKPMSKDIVKNVQKGKTKDNSSLSRYINAKSINQFI